MSSVGIKNSWKYEKDLVIIFNETSLEKTIRQSSNIFDFFIIIIK